MTQLAQVLMTFMALVICSAATLVFLVGFALLAKQGIAPAEAIAGVVCYSAISLALIYGGWRLIAWARSMSRC
jgi:hypothetical protein